MWFSWWVLPQIGEPLFVPDRAFVSSISQKTLSVNCLRIHSDQGFAKKSFSHFWERLVAAHRDFCEALSPGASSLDRHKKGCYHAHSSFVYVFTIVLPGKR